MKNFFNGLAIVATIILAASCSGSRGGGGELTGVQTTPYNEMLPTGMVYIQSGSFTMGPNDQNAFFETSKQNKQVNVEKFWMDDTEITNSEYRQFVYWLKDHLTRLAIYQNQISMESDEFALMDDEGNIKFIDEENNIPYLDYDEKIDMKDPEIQEFLDTLFYEYSPYEGRRILRTDKLNYTYTEIDLYQAAKKINQLDPVTARYKTKGRTEKDLIRRDTAYMTPEGIVRTTKYVQLRDRNDFFITRTINIYPDTLCWMRNYTYSFNEPYTLYFSHPGYAEYPVVGVSWEQARAFCNWRTKFKNDYLESIGQPGVQRYRLPTEAEWEYAARGGKQSSMYPWGGPYIRRADGCFLANFKPGKGDYIKDGYIIPAAVASYPANDWGLFDMAGNVAEWTESAYIPSALAVVNDLNPSFTYDAKNDDPEIMKRKVVKGGSWKDVSAFLQCGMQTAEYQDATLPYVGFRCVRTVIQDLGSY